jgi:hypothetical protein
MPKPRDFAVVRRAVAEMVAQDPGEYIGILNTMAQVAARTSAFRKRAGLDELTKPFDAISDVMERAAGKVYGILS